MRRHLLPALAFALAGLGCSGWRAVERGDYEVVWATNAAARKPEEGGKVLAGYGGFGQEVISRDRYDEELAGGTRRKVEPPQGLQPQFLHEVGGTVTLAVGELRSFRLDELKEPLLEAQGNAVELYLTVPRRVDGWKGDQAVDGRESYVHLLGRRPGKSQLRLTTGQDRVAVEVVVTQKKAD